MWSVPSTIARLLRGDDDGPAKTGLHVRTLVRDTGIQGGSSVVAAGTADTLVAADVYNVQGSLGARCHLLHAGARISRAPATNFARWRPANGVNCAGVP